MSSSVKEITATVAAGTRRKIPGRGSFLFAKTTTAPIKVSMIEVETGTRDGDDVTVTMSNSDKIRSAPGKEFDEIVVFNDSAAPVTFTLIYGTGDYDRPVPDTVNVAVSVPASNSVTTIARNEVTAAEEVAAFNASRTKVIVQADPANDQNIVVGDSNITTTRGIVLQPGETIAFETQGAIYAMEVVAGTNYVNILEEAIA